MRNLFFALLTACLAAVGMCQEKESPKHWSEWESVKIAAAQVEIHTGHSIDVMEQYADQAAKDGAEMIVFGEYLMGPFFEDRGAGVDRLAAAAKKHHMYIVAGGWEELEEGAFARLEPKNFANTVLIFGRDGEVVGRYRKVHAAVGEPPYFWPPTGNEHEWLMEPGHGFPTFQLDFARVGIMTCYDGYFPESASSLSLNGAELILWLNGRAGPLEPYIVRTDMFRNFCAMVATNLAPGSGTMIGTWPESLLAHVEETGNHYIIADIPLKALREQRANSRMFHQRRPELYETMAQEHKPWEPYVPYGHVEPEVKPIAADENSTKTTNKE